MGLFALGFILGGLFGGGIMALMNASKVNELSAEGSLGKGNSGEEMNAEYDKGYQSGYDAGYKRAMLDYGLEDDKPCEDCVSRQAVLACEQHIWTDCGVVSVEDIKALPPVTPTPTECEDAVSRDSLLENVRAVKIDGKYQHVIFWNDIKTLPPVTPKQTATKEGDGE